MPNTSPQWISFNFSCFGEIFVGKYWNRNHTLTWFHKVRASTIHKNLHTKHQRKRYLIDFSPPDKIFDFSIVSVCEELKCNFLCVSLGKPLFWQCFFSLHKRLIIVNKNLTEKWQEEVFKFGNRVIQKKLKVLV